MKSGNITLGGILIALTIIILYSASILPVSTISVLTIASAITILSAEHMQRLRLVQASSLFQTLVQLTALM